MTAEEQCCAYSVTVVKTKKYSILKRIKAPYERKQWTLA